MAHERGPNPSLKRRWRLPRSCSLWLLRLAKQAEEAELAVGLRRGALHSSTSWPCWCWHAAKTVSQLRAGDSDVRQPSLPNQDQQAADEIPPGLKRGRGREEVRSGDRKGQGGGVLLWLSKIPPAGGTSTLQACQTAVHCTANSRGIQGILGGCSAYRCPTLASEQGVSYTPTPKICQLFHMSRWRKAGAVKGTVAQCTHSWQDPQK